MSDFTTPEGCEASTTPQLTATAPARHGLRSAALSRLAVVFGLWTAVAVLYWPSALALDGLWRSSIEETYTHGYLVLLISLWLILRSRVRLGAEPVRPAPAALVALAILSVLWLWAWRAAIQQLHLLLVPLLLLAAIVAALGWRTGRLLAFPVGYLYFAMPLWGDINGIVRGLSSRMTGALIWVTGLPAYMQGDYIHLPGGTIEIANSCSGLHALIVGLALAALYGEVLQDTRRRRIEWLVTMGVLSLVVNWIRIFIVITAAYATDMHSSLVKNHYWLGWWLFAAAFVAFLWWAGRRSDAPLHRQPEQAGNAVAPSSDQGIRFARLALVLGALAALPALSYGMDWVHSAGSVAIDWPVAPKGWQGPQPRAAARWSPHFHDPSAESLRVYTDTDGESVEVFAVSYRTQTQAGKLLGYQNSLLGAHGLHKAFTRIVDSSSGRWRETEVVNPTGARSLIWARYRIGNEMFVHPRLSQLWYGTVALVRPPLSSLTALRTACVPDCRAAMERLTAASRNLQPTVRLR